MARIRSSLARQLHGWAGTIAVDQGLDPTGASTAAVPAGQMCNGAAVLAYFLYSDSPRSVPWKSTGGELPAP
ncbi:MAG: spore coat protein U domain-containing protein, partial [Candidatus Acidiferrales bacterium]